MTEKMREQKAQRDSIATTNLSMHQQHKDLSSVNEINLSQEDLLMSYPEHSKYYKPGEIEFVTPKANRLKVELPYEIQSQPSFQGGRRGAG